MEIKRNLYNIAGLESLKGKLKGERVFLRADFNVPIQNGKVMDAYRIHTTMKTFAFLKDEGAITIVVSHVETKDVAHPTLLPVFEYIQNIYPEYSIVFSKNFLEQHEVSDLVAQAQEGSFILFENIRNAKEEGMSEKGDDEKFALYLKQFADYYINDAFAVCHRAHTSVSKLPVLFDAHHKVAGAQLFIEIQSLSKALNPTVPFVTILSGAKFGTKLPLIEKYIKTANLVFVGGALYNNVLKSLGYNVGVSLVDPDAQYVDDLVKTKDFTDKVCIPQHVIVKNTETGTVEDVSISAVQETQTIQDISVASIQEFVNKIEALGAKIILWNGPVGNFEVSPFEQGTLELGKLLLQYVKNHADAHMIVGGGDTVSAISGIEGMESNSAVFISTGGGAMLEFLEKEGQIPGVLSLL